MFEEARSITRSGLTDARAKFSVNLVGNPAMGLRAFVKAPRKTIVGTSLTVTPPTGQYDGAKLINLGTNRWAFKPEVGIAVPKGPWDFDAYLGVWFFTDNDEFYPGAREALPGPGGGASGPRELHVQASTVGGDRRDVWGLNLLWGAQNFDDLRLVGYVNGQPAAEQRISADGLPYALVLEPDDSELKADGMDMTRLVFKIVDCYGNRLPYTNQVVSFEIDGPDRN